MTASLKMSPQGIFLMVAVPLLAIFLGLAVAVSPVIATGIALAFGGAIVLFMRPDWAWIVTLLLVVQAIPGAFVPEIPLGFARAKVYELTFLTGLAGSLAQFKSVKNRPLVGGSWRKCGVLVAAILLSVFYSRFYLKNHDLVLAEARPYLALVALGFVANIYHDAKTKWQIDRTLIVAGTVLSCIVIVQMLTGMRLLDARIEDLGLSANTGITRSLTDTGTIVQAYAIYRLAALSHSSAISVQLRFLAAVALVLAIVGLLGTFTRGAWIATGAGALVAAYVAGGVGRALKTALSGALLMVVVVTAIFVVRPQLGEAMFGRLLSVSNELESGASYGWRRLENRLAIDSIQERPLLGVALGGAYKNEVMRAAGFLNDEYFIHNGYLYFPLKMGIPGVMLGLYLLWQIALLIVRHQRGSSLHAAQAGTCVVILAINISAPVLGKFLPLFILFTFAALRASETQSLPKQQAPL